MIYAETHADHSVAVEVVDLSSPEPWIKHSQSELGEAVAIFYAGAPAALGLLPGSLVPATAPPTRALPAGFIGAFAIEATAGGGRWTELAGASIPPLLADFRIPNRACARFDTSTHAMSSTSAAGLVALDSTRTLAFLRSSDPSAQVLVLTATDATPMPRLSRPGERVTGFSAHGDDWSLATATAERLILYRGSWERGWSEVSSSTVAASDPIELLGWDATENPPRLYGRTYGYRLLDLSHAPWRLVFEGSGAPNEGGLAFQPGVGLLVAARRNGVEVILRVAGGAVEVEPTPEPNTVHGMGEAGGSAWLGLSFGKAFRRTGNGWERHAIELVGDIDSFLPFRGGVLVGTEDGVLIELGQAEGDCVAQRVTAQGRIRRIAPLGQGILIAVDNEGVDALERVSVSD